jgi:hypothetical protein
MTQETTEQFIARLRDQDAVASRSEAAYVIESQQAEIERLRAALRLEVKRSRRHLAAPTSPYEWDDIPDTPEQRALIATHNGDIRRKYPNMVKISEPTPEHDLEMMRQRASWTSGVSEKDSRARWSQYHNALQGMYERGVLIRADTLAAAIDAAVRAETERCAGIVSAARNGDISTDFRSILHFINDGDSQ